MKAISIKQPYVSQIASGEKTIEYRSWATKYRGDILICASKTPAIAGLPVGVALCIVELYNITRDFDRYEWHLRNIRLINPPVPVRGMPGLYNVEYQT